MNVRVQHLFIFCFEMYAILFYLGIQTVLHIVLWFTEIPTPSNFHLFYSFWTLYVIGNDIFYFCLFQNNKTRSKNEKKIFIFLRSRIWVFYTKTQCLPLFFLGTASRISIPSVINLYFFFWVKNLAIFLEMENIFMYVFLSRLHIFKCFASYSSSTMRNSEYCFIPSSFFDTLSFFLLRKRKTFYTLSLWRLILRDFVRWQSLTAFQVFFSYVVWFTSVKLKVPKLEVEMWGPEIESMDTSITYGYDFWWRICAYNIFTLFNENVFDW